MDPEPLERITARRAALDELEEQLAKQLAEVRAERDELAVAEKVLERMSEQRAEERASAGPAPGQVGGRAVMMIPHRTPGVAETMLPPDYQRILAVVRGAVAREAGQAGRPRLASETARRPVHHSPVTRDAAALMALID
jgi:hypothetical protein